MQIDNNIKAGRLYWGAMPLPQGAELLGVVTRDNGETGAAIKMPTGRTVQGNAGAIRTLPEQHAHVRKV